jgi:hypothetical protein
MEPTIAAAMAPRIASSNGVKVAAPSRYRKIPDLPCICPVSIRITFIIIKPKMIRPNKLRSFVTVKVV